MKRIFILYRKIAVRLIRYYYQKRGRRGNALMFIPHSGMSKTDLYDLFNYRSDSSLSFARYLLDNSLLKEREFIVFTPSKEDIVVSYDKAKTMFPDKKITFISWDCFILDYTSIDCIKKATLFSQCVARCSHIFTSITHRLQHFISDQIAVDLNYYAAPLKNDIIPRTDKYYLAYDLVGKEYDKLVMTSEVGIRMAMAFMRSMEKPQFADWGLCRNDNLFTNESFDNIKQTILSSVSYPANKIFLYTPTHRDYEEFVKDTSRSLLGYSMNLIDFHEFLKSEGIVIVAKIHPRQNEGIISHELPESIIIHQPQHHYGLTELMIISDCLITDYTTVYYDYLLLDKPVIFNFYDSERYGRERGFSFSPIECITAGDIVRNPEELKSAINNISVNYEQSKEKRKFVRDLIFAYQDGKTCSRVYDYYFGRIKE